MANRATKEYAAQTYVVRKNDCLSAIARRLTGSADYSAIYKQNKELIGENPNDIKVDMELVIPGDASQSEDW